MAKKLIMLRDEAVLRKKAKPVNNIDPLILHLLDDMAETMYDSAGIGLAGPQVNVSKRLIVVDIGDGLLKLINPKVVKKEGAETATEGCLSVPRVYGEVERAAKILIKALSAEGINIKMDCEGLLARVIQHEIDHLDGILFIDKAQDIREITPEQETEMLESVEEELERRKTVFETSRQGE